MRGDGRLSNGWQAGSQLQRLEIIPEYPQADESGLPETWRLSDLRSAAQLCSERHRAALRSASALQREVNLKRIIKWTCPGRSTSESGGYVRKTLERPGKLHWFRITSVQDGPAFSRLEQLA